MNASKPQADHRPVQAARVASFLERQPGSTAKEIDAECDTGCITKVLSDMTRLLGYGIAKGWREVTCASGRFTRKVRTYTLLYRPSTQPDLFAPDA